MNLEELDVKAPLGAYSTFDSGVAKPYLEALKPGQVYAEVGVDKGKSLYIARQLTAKGVKVYGVDLKDDPKVKGAVFIQGDSRTVKLSEKVDLLFIDGDHTYEGVKADIENWYPQMVKGGVVMFHDCDDTGPGVVKAAEELAEKVGKTLWQSPNQRCGMGVVEL